MSQLGMMVIAVGLSCYNIALFHLINHAFYKGLLFLAAGSVIHAVADNQDFRKYGGLLIFLPLTYSVILIGSLSLVAFPFMTGFYSKDFILESAYGQFFFSSIIIYYIAIIAALFTTLYSVKVLYLTFLTNPNGSLIDYKKAHEGDIFMSLPLIILAIFSIFFGFITKDIFIGLGTGFFMDNGLFIHPDHGTIIETEFAVPTFYKLLPLFTTLLFTLIAIFISELYPNILIYIKFSKIGYNMFGFFNQRFLIELLYNKYIINILFLFGGHTTKIIDKGSIEYIGPYGLEYSLIYVSNNISKLDSGIITSYALYILSGLMFYIFIAYIYYFDNIIIIILLLITLFVNSFIELSKPLCNFDIYYQNRNININMASIFHRNRYFNLENFSFIFHLVLLLYLLFPLCKLPIYDVIDSMTVFDEEFKLDYKHLDFDFIDDDPSKGVCFMENNNPESSGSNTEDNSNLANSDQNTENSSNLANTDQNTENSFNNVDQNAENSPNNVDQNNGVENTQPIDNSAAADLNSSLPTVQFNNPWDHSRIADCEHRDRNTHGFAQDLGDQPIPCDICTHNATTNPGDYASFCNSCGAIICHDCDLIVSGEGPSPIDTDSGFEDED
jgi:NADH-ubiquinone oxidoreductase chain 5